MIRAAFIIFVVMGLVDLLGAVAVASKPSGVNQAGAVAFKFFIGIAILTFGIVGLVKYWG